MHILTAHKQTLAIDPKGAVIIAYSHDGMPILYERRQIDGKWRGGSHVCVPNFGPGGKSDQPQHGFGRVVDWRVELQQADRIKLGYAQASGSYAGLRLSLLYILQEQGMTMQLTVHNTSAGPLRITPGFHPYFALPLGHDGRFWLDETEHHTREVADSPVYTAPSKTVQLILDEAHRYTLTSNTLRQYVLWTAHPQQYVCIEPTLAANAYSEAPASSEELLAPGDAQHYTVTIAKY